MITISQWAGLATNASPYGLPPGATVEQVNLQCLSPGKLTVRRGIASDPMNGGSPIVQIFLHYNRNVATVIYQRADGTVAFRGGVDSTAPSPPLSVALQSSPGTPTQLALATAPLPPTGISLGNQSGAPSGVTLTVAPRSPISPLLKTAPTAPPTVGTLSAPRNLTATLDISAPGQPTNLELATVPSNPYGLTLAFAPGEPYGVTVQTAPTPPSSVSLTTGPDAPSGVSLATGPDAPTNVTAVGPTPDPYMGLVVLLLQDQATDESPAGQTLIFNGSSSITSSLSKVGPKSFFTTSGSYPTNMVEVANSGDLFADRDWTVEMWVRRTTASDTTYLWSTGTASGALQFLINGTRITMSRPNNVYLDSGALTWNADQWYHIAGVRSGNTVMAFRDGVLVATGSFSATYAAINDLNYAFGAQSATHDAYFDSVRVTDGYARYTSAGFTPPLVSYTIGPPIAPTGVTLTNTPQAPSLISVTPSTPDPYFSSVVALSQDTQYDESPYALTFVYSNSSMTNSVSKVGEQCLDLTAASSERRWSRSSAWFEDRDFTIEFWAMFPNYSSSGVYRFLRDVTTGPYFLISAGNLRVSRSNNVFVNTSVSLNANTWYHFALTRRDNGSGTSDYYEVFLDGVSVGTGTRVETWASTADIVQNGEMYIDSFRVTDGVARYTANFTPETRAFSTQ